MRSLAEFRKETSDENTTAERVASHSGGSKTPTTGPKNSNYRGKGDLDGGGYLHFLFFEAGLVGLDYGEG
jgi:hypothetical protein